MQELSYSNDNLLGLIITENLSKIPIASQERSGLGNSIISGFYIYFLVIFIVFLVLRILWIKMASQKMEGR